jgi:hypothetical protein
MDKQTKQQAILPNAAAESPCASAMGMKAAFLVGEGKKGRSPLQGLSSHQANGRISVL